MQSYSKAKDYTSGARRTQGRRTPLDIQVLRTRLSLVIPCPINPEFLRQEKKGDSTKPPPIPLARKPKPMES